jgi:hypothetical protein
MDMSRGASTRVIAAAVVTVVIGLAHPALAQAPAPPAAETPAVDLISGVYPDGTRWGMQKPANWNGTVIVDLDGAPPATPTGRANPFNAWLLSKGYAVGGITREPVGYDFPKAVDYLLTVRQAAIDRWGPARRTLVVGNSRGAFAARKALELRPDIFDGGFISAGGGAGEIAVLRNKLNSLFVLKTLLDPTGSMKLVSIDPAVENPALNTLVSKARTTPQGRARLAFAAAMQQFALWSSRNAPKPAPDDYEAQLDQIADNFGFGTALTVRAGVEKIAGGNVSWNTDADYGALLERSGRQAMVEALYRKAGLDLQADLALLKRMPRISADPQAVRRAEPLMTYSGKIQDPVVNVDNDDPVDPAADKLAYRRTLEKAGTVGLFRLLWADGAGHGGQTALDRAVAFDLLIERVDTGRWGDASLPALRGRGEKVAASSSVDLGRLSLFEPPAIAAPLNTWDAGDWGTYRPTR